MDTNVASAMPNARITYYRISDNHTKKNVVSAQATYAKKTYSYKQLELIRKF